MTPLCLSSKEETLQFLHTHTNEDSLHVMFLNCSVNIHGHLVYDVGTTRTDLRTHILLIIRSGMGSVTH